LKAIVFTGLSLSHKEASGFLDVEYRPPVKRGDIDALLTDPPSIIGIIDGQFLQNLSVSPKEILRALRAGFTVFGSSSMGALRAVELESYGMVGVGNIFKLYRSGRIDADDEVALVFSSHDMKPLSEPAVNFRFALQGACEEGIICAREKNALMRLVKSLYYPERSYPKLLSFARDRLPLTKASALEYYLLNRAPDMKRQDAISLLREIGKLLQANGG
jgi:hypothetical protein